MIYATRRSPLALAQSRAFIRLLLSTKNDLAIEELQVVTSGDKIVSETLQEFGGKGLFIKELEEALLDGRAHFAVHSLKDVPAQVAPGLTIACVSEREDPRDALISRSGAPLSALPPGACIGTSSLRRMVALRLARPDLTFIPFRGNVDTRLRKLEEGQCDATVLAMAGLRRLGLESRATEVLAPQVCLPAIGQGALGVECREEDQQTIEVLSALDHGPTAICVAAERAVLAAVEGGCRTPVAAYAIRDGETLWLRAQLAEADGTRPRAGERRIPWPAQPAEAAAVGTDLGTQLKRW